MATSTEAVTRARLLAATRDIHAILAAQCAAEEHAATLSATSVQALYDAGILAMKLPRELGGAEADPATQLEVLEALAQASPAAAWCAMVGATSVGMPGAFLPDEGIARMFGGGRIPRGAIVVMPAGVAEATAGGHRLSGRWSFASGVRHAEWVVVAARCAAAQGPTVRLFAVPATAVEIHDNWQVAGLRGTGSCDITIADSFVPACLSWDARSDAPRRGGALYRLGIPAFVANEHAAFALGVARSALDGLLDIARAKLRSYRPGAVTLAQRASVQRTLGRGGLELDAARTLALDLNRRAYDTVAAGALLDGRQQAELRAVGTYCTEVAVNVVSAAFRHVGGGAIFDAHPLQRCLRDIQCAAQHLIVSESAYENLGQFLLGVADADAMA